MKYQVSSKMIMCIACSKGSDAEVLHPILKVPICGGCNAALNDADQAIVNENRVSCTWCGLGDGCELFMCDSCPNSFCTDCVERNFGLQEAAEVRAAPVWTCYCCFPTMKFKDLQMLGDYPFYNLDKAYAAVRPPDSHDFDHFDVTLAEALNREEKWLASLFCHGLISSSIQDLDIAAVYLAASDVFTVMYRVSPALRRFFRSKVFLLPGLFKTEYGREYQCKLHYHQLVGLNYMTTIENKTTEFGALRGGIFGDEPGLGKTVTCLGLIASTAGVIPQQPAVFWDEEELESHWKLMMGQYTTLLMPCLNRVNRLRVVVEKGRGEVFSELMRHVDKYCDTLKGFEEKAKSAIRAATGSNKLLASKMVDKFRIEMSKVKEGLDSKKRKINLSRQLDQRIRFERSLIPSCATLIIVPETLLEHWYEQIKRHLNLNYFSYSSDLRGVVYMDGLGDIVDISPPISKLIPTMSESSTAADELASFTIVVTTFERCAAENRKLKKILRGGGNMRNSESSNNGEGSSVSAITAHLNSNPLLKVRWLRLVIDEGHELGQVKRRGADEAVPLATNLAKQLQLAIDESQSDVSKFIAQIAAERRWIMSGTPTTGANSELGLTQLYRLLCFLRHPLTLLETDSVVTSAAESGSHDVTASARKKKRVAPPSSPTPSAVPSSLNAVTVKLEGETATDITTSSSSSSSSSSSESVVDGGTGSAQEDALNIITSSASSASLSSLKNQLSEIGIHSSQEYWIQKVVIPCLQQQPDAWFSLTDLLRQILVRHTKDDLLLFDPIPSTVNLDQMPLAGDAEEVLATDRAKAHYIATTMWKALSDYKAHSMSGAYRRTSRATFGGLSEGTRMSFGSHRVARHAIVNHIPEGDSSHLPGSPVVTKVKRTLTPEEVDVAKSRKPKAIVFSQHHTDVQGVGHMLYDMMGDSFVCEHYGQYRSSELSRFRHSKRRFRVCPLCGYDNPIDNDRYCTKVLIIVEYLDVVPPAEDTEPPAPQPGGHGAAGPGGHFNGLCYCSPTGCQTDEEKAKCCRYPNAFHAGFIIGNPNCAIIGLEHIEGYQPGDALMAEQIIRVRSVDAMEAAPVLWRGGIMGGRAVVKFWKICGGKDVNMGWHGSRILQNMPWVVEDQTSCILLLEADGSTGLDLSFATHIFLLERVKDPALKRQIVSRAHRMGATGPVKVQLIQVKSEKD